MVTLGTNGTGDTSFYKKEEYKMLEKVSLCYRFQVQRKLYFTPSVHHWSSVFLISSPEMGTLQITKNKG